MLEKTMEEFKQLGLSDNVIEVLKKKGFTKPTTIQVKVIPLLLEGEKDVVGQSQTGTGKTASFALPILERIKERSKTVQAIILTPTRELALQVSQEIDSLKGNKNIRILSVYGGASIGPQRQKLKDGVDIVVGTPGRVMDLQRRRSLKLDDIKYAVLDEADEMLNMGFVEDIETILQHTPKDKKMLLFSATMPKPILKIAKRYMHEYEFIEVEKAHVVTKNVEQIYYDINPKDRVEALKRIIDNNLDFHGIVFCKTKAEVDVLSNQLVKMSYGVAGLHGDIAQNQREKILQQFRKKHVNVLVATDVAARGIDVNDLTHVINYSLPQSPQLYVHRIGRTGRAGKKGIAITFVIPSEKRKLVFVERTNNCKLIKQKLPSAKDIIKHKEAQIKTIIKNIIDATAGKASKYKLMAKELLEEHDSHEVVAAVLKYSLKHELDFNSYRDISEPKPSRHSSNSGRGGFRRGRSSRSGKSRSKNRSNGDRSEKKRYSGSRSKKGNNSRKSGSRHKRRN
ncbi:MAG: DEAD/DEAH box helicase [Nanoarchaeota archaeon]|nr:DEAD/DEAH box helicase [Nanoarchaeota archaeon]